MIQERKFLSSWGMALMLSALAWLFTFLEAVLTLSVMDVTLWSHNYMVFAAAATFVCSYIYMKKVEDLSWLEEGVAFGIVFVLVNLLMDYGILFLLLQTSVFTLQNLFLFIVQFLICILSAFVVNRKYSDTIGLRLKGGF